MKMARGIDSQKLVDALDEAFKPRLALPGRSAASLAKFMEVRRLCLTNMQSKGPAMLARLFIFLLFTRFIGAFVPRITFAHSGKQVVQEVAGGQCDEGDEFVFTITGGNTLTVTAKKMKQQGAVVHGKQAVVDADIAFALFDTYLGGTLPEVAPTLTADINRTLAV
mmetsp:Transcript_27082/g.55419  ORF Transcript_27082/g.55419 Transcript_27082/m.55419 type:complete len:166 (+) Transcript_27082:509-1006(+)